MPAVIGSADVVIQARVQPQTHPANPLIDQAMPRRQAVVHGVVGKDEQAGVQEAPTQNPADDQQWMQLTQLDAQANDQRDQPGDCNQSSQLQASLSGDLQAVTWHQASAVQRARRAGRSRRSRSCRSRRAGNARRRSCPLRGQTRGFAPCQ